MSGGLTLPLCRLVNANATFVAQCLYERNLCGTSGAISMTWGSAEGGAGATFTTTDMGGSNVIRLPDHPCPRASPISPPPHIPRPP